jgi:hypothetical protein
MQILEHLFLAGEFATGGACIRAARVSAGALAGARCASPGMIHRPGDSE